MTAAAAAVPAEVGPVAAIAWSSLGSPSPFVADGAESTPRPLEVALAPPPFILALRCFFEVFDLLGGVGWVDRKEWFMGRGGWIWGCEVGRT